MKRSMLGLLILGGMAVQGCGGTEDDRPVTWSYIVPAIIAPNCATSSCHNSAAAVAGLDLSTVDHAYTSLLGLRVPKTALDGDETGQGINTAAEQARPLVSPNNPSQSRIVTMMRAVGANRMPPDRPMAEADIALIERWILAGARKN